MIEFNSLAAETAKTNPELDKRFVIVKDGNGTPQVIANLDHEDWMPKTGRVEIDSMKKSTRHRNQKQVKVINDKETGYRFGIPLGIDPDTKEIKYLAIMVSDFEYYNLENKMDRYKAIIITRSEFVEGSPNLYGTPQYKVVDKEKEAVKYLNTISAKKRARDISENLNIAEMREIGPAMGIDERANSENMLRAAIYKKVEDKPEEFLKIYENPKRKSLVIFKSCYSRGIITFSSEFQTYIFENVPMGRTEEEAIEYIHERATLMLTLDNVLKNVKITTVSNQNVKTTIKEEETEEALIAKLEAIRAKKTASAPPSLDDDEMIALRNEAKEMGIKGYALPTMTKEKLQQKIAEQKLAESK